MAIEYIPYNKIDKKKWDSCVRQSAGRKIFGYSCILDHFCTNWDAIVINDYEAVFAIPWRKKMGLKYIYSPYFIQNFSLHSSSKTNIEVYPEIFTLVEKHFNFADFFVCINGDISSKMSHIKKEKRNNFLIDINKPYEENYESWGENLRKNIRKGKNKALRYVAECNTTLLINEYKLLSQKRKFNFLNKDIDDLKQFLDNCIEHYILRSIEDADGNVLASAIFLKDSTRIYYLLGLVHHNCNNNIKAHEFLLNGVIEEFSEKKMYLDLLGSDVAGVAEFYKQFQPETQHYSHYYFNHLPYPLRLLKQH